MNKQEFIEMLKQNMPKGLDEIETAKYIYIKLGKEKAFDEKYFFGNSKTKKEIYKMAERTNYNTDIVAKNRKIICVSLSYLYRDILKEFGIKSIINQEEDHKYPVLLLKDGKRLKADLQQDLYNIQTKCKTKYFGTKFDYDYTSLFELSDERTLEIDKKIKYIKDEVDYKNNAIEAVKEKVKDKTPGECLKIIFDDGSLNNFEGNIGFIEIVKYYKGVFYKTIKKYIDKKIFSFNCYKENEDGEREYTMCIYSEEKEEVNAYMLSNKINKFIKVDLDKIEQLEKEGLIFDTKEKGIKRFKKIIEKRKQNQKNYEKTFE